MGGQLKLIGDGGKLLGKVLGMINGFKLIIMTVKIIFVKESTEGFEDAEK